MKVLSLFDGCSCAMVALRKLGIIPDEYFASEIEKWAMIVSKDNYPEIQQIGDVRNVKAKDLPVIDLLCGGSPCQDLRPGRDGLLGEKSKLFYEYARVLKEVQGINPKVYFLFENVTLISKEDKQIITEILGVTPHKINAGLLSAQNRHRYYWTNIPFQGQPAEKNIYLKDITLNGEQYCLRWQNSQTGPVIDTKMCTLKALSGRGGVRQQPLIFINDLLLSPEELNRAEISYRGKVWKTGNRMGKMAFPDRIDKKARTLCATTIKGNRQTIHIKEGENVRILHPIEYERLQGLPDNYTAAAITGKRYQMCGNGWNVDTIVHLFEPLLWLDVI